LGQTIQPHGCVSVDQQSDVDAVTGRKREALEQRPPHGNLSGERLLEAGQVRIEEVQQRAGRELGHAATLVRKRELTEAKRAPVMGLDKRYPRIVDERSEQAGDEVRAEVLGVGVKEANDLASEHWQRPPQGVALAEHLPELWSQLALCMDLCPKLACDLGRAVNGVVNYHDLVDQPELAQLSEAAEDGPNRAHLVASRQADGHRTHLRGAQPRRECGRGAELAVVKGIALVPAQG